MHWLSHDEQLEIEQLVELCFDATVAAVANAVDHPTPASFHSPRLRWPANAFRLGRADGRCVRTRRSKRSAPVMQPRCAHHLTEQLR